jgi:hypothetical protein
MKKQFLFAVGIVLLSASIVSAEAAPQIRIQNLRSNAMGGARLSIIDDQYAMMNNPAGPAVLRYKNVRYKKETDSYEPYSYRNTWVSLMQAQATVSGDFLAFWDHKDSITDAASADSDDFDIDNATYNYLTRLRLAGGTTPIYFALQNVLPLNLSLAFFNSGNARVTTNPDIPLPTWNILAYHDAAAVLNFAHKVPNLELGVIGKGGSMMELSFGVNAKLIQRVQFGKEGADLFYLGSLGELDMESLDLRRGMALGMDLGVIAAFYWDVDDYKWRTQKRQKPDLLLSATLTDFYRTRFSWTKPNDLTLGGILFGDGEPGGTGYIDPSLAIGAAYNIGTIIPLALDDFTVAMDIREIFSSATTTFLKIYAGFEFSTLKAFKIRGGIFQGYLCAGLGIDIPVLPMEIDFAYWAEELGMYPGQERLDNFGVTLNIVF